MEDKVSFIPKKTIGASEYKSRGLGVVTGFTLIIFLISAALWGALFLYERYLKEQISQKKSSLQIAQSELEPSLVTSLVLLSGKISAAKTLIQNHKAPSSIFVFLEGNTLKDVRFKDFNFSFSTDGAPSISMSGLAKSYSSLALQAGVFEKSSIVKKAAFSGFKLDKNGQVGFNVEIVFDLSLLAYNLE
ncbi:MAG: hypothetical protein AAB890_01590 [Patescibacteria group bacterium]